MQSTPPPNPFQALAGFTAAPREIMVYRNDDILDVVNEWWPHQLALPLDQRGEPKNTRLEVKPGAQGHAVKIVPLSVAHTELVDAIPNSLSPPRIAVTMPDASPSAKPSPSEMIYDDADWNYLSQREQLEKKRLCMIVLLGVVGLHESTPGASDEEKAAAVASTMPYRLIRFLAANIYESSFGVGDTTDFFTKEGSGDSPSSGPLPSKSPRAGKGK